MARTLRRTVAALVLALICAGCNLAVKVDVAVKADGSGTITLTATADKAIVEQAPQIGTDLRFDDLVTAGWTVHGPTPTPDGGLEVVLAHAFQTPEQATSILASINGKDGPLVGLGLARVKAKGTTTFTLSGALQLTGGLDAFSDSDLLAAVGGTPYSSQLTQSSVPSASAVGVTLSADLPGTVGANNAAKGPGLTWTVPTDGTSLSVTASSQIHDKKNVWAHPLAKGALIALIAWLSLTFLFVVYVWAARRRRYMQRALR